MNNKEITYFWTGVIWTTIGFGGTLTIATIMRFFETQINFFLAFVMLGWVLFWVNNGKIAKFSHQISEKIMKESRRVHDSKGGTGETEVR